MYYYDILQIMIFSKGFRLFILELVARVNFLGNDTSFIYLCTTNI